MVLVLLLPHIGLPSALYDSIDHHLFTSLIFFSQVLGNNIIESSFILNRTRLAWSSSKLAYLLLLNVN